mgnify:CR=1 FL=1
MPVNLKKDDMGDVITDFYKSDAPQFKGKSKKKRREMAIAAKLSADEVKEGASILKVRGKRNTYMGATGDHRRDKEGNIEASFYNKKPAPTGNKGKKIDYKKPKRDLVAMRAAKKARREKREARARERAASVNEEKLLEKFGQWKQAVKNRDKAHKKPNRKAPKQGSIKSRVKKGVGRVPLKDVNTPAEKQSMQGVGGFRGVHGSNRKSKAAQGKPAPVVYSYKKKEVSEGKLDRVMDTVRKYTSGKKPERKAQKAMDAGARAKRLLQRKEYASKVSGSTDIVPDDIRDHKIW